jgi:hypothetical protein
MVRPASDYPDDVTVYLVEEDFGPNGRAYSRGHQPMNAKAGGDL